MNYNQIYKCIICNKQTQKPKFGNIFFKEATTFCSFDCKRKYYKKNTVILRTVLYNLKRILIQRNLLRSKVVDKRAESNQ